MIYGIYGDIGSGKSWKQMHYGLRRANELRKKLVVNFGINRRALKRYAAANKLWWVVWLVDNEQIAVIDAAEELAELFECKNSVVLLDEAGIFLNSRDFAKTPKRLLMDLAQSRKDGNDLIYAAQFDAQIDKQFRMLTQWFIHCNGLSKTDRQTRRPKLYWKQYAHFKGAEYKVWSENPKVMSSMIRTWMAATHMQYGPFTKADAALFEVFDSFARLEEQSQHAVRHSEKLLHISGQTPTQRITELRRTQAFTAKIQQYDRLWKRDKLRFFGLPFSEVRLYFKYRKVVTTYQNGYTTNERQRSDVTDHDPAQKGPQRGSPARSWPPQIASVPKAENDSCKAA